jgi:hypothetical protein
VFNLTWPVESWSFVLESTESLASPNWTSVSPAALIVGNNFTLTIASDGIQRFFRLKHQ